MCFVPGDSLSFASSENPCPAEPVGGERARNELGPARQKERVDRLRRFRVSGPVLAGIVLGGLSFLVTVATLDAVGEVPGGWTGPGLTIDEPFNIVHGQKLADALLAGDLVQLWQADRELFDHPPLARVWIGLWHEVSYLVWPRRGDEARLSVFRARLGSAASFAMTVFLVAWLVGRWQGTASAWATGSLFATLPRTFGEGHLATLESTVTLTYLLPLAYLVDRALVATGHPIAVQTSDSVAASRPIGRRDEYPSLALRDALVVGGLLGLACLTKMQGFLLIPWVVLWWCLCEGRRAAWHLAVVAGLAATLFFLGWPALWDAPIERVTKFFGSATVRSPLYVWYLGREWTDRALPWHYPFVLFGVTVPVVLHVAAGYGLWLGWRTRGERWPVGLLLAGVVGPLIVFSVPGVAVYDGTRLFGMIVGPWSLLAGRGIAAWLRDGGGRLSSRAAGVVWGVIIGIQVGVLALHVATPLSYYNLLVGGLPGANRLGFQTTYWGDSLTRELLAAVSDEAPRGAQIHVSPVLHPLHLRAIEAIVPALRRKEQAIVPFDEDRRDEVRYLLVFYRREYLPQAWRAEPAIRAGWFDEIVATPPAPAFPAARSNPERKSPERPRTVRPLAERRLHGVLLGGAYAITP